MNHDHQIVIVNQQDKYDVASMHSLVQRATLIVLRQHDVDPCAVNIVFTSNDEIQQLNERFRQLDEPTDVLSFPMDGDNIDYGPRMLGDVVISVEKAFEQATQYGHSAQREFAFLTVHGVLHLLGYDHNTEEQRVTMRMAEEQALQELNVQR